MSTRLKRLERGMGEALVKLSVVICSCVLATFPLPDWMFYEYCSIRKGGRLIIQLTEVLLWWMGKGAGGRGWWGVIKLSASLLEWSCSDWEGTKERLKAGEGRQILACKWASACVQYAPYVQMCMCLCCEGEAVCSELLLMSVFWTITQLVQYERY